MSSGEYNRKQALTQQNSTFLLFTGLLLNSQNEKEKVDGFNCFFKLKFRSGDSALLKMISNRRKKGGD
jgi:hypothetical protein